MVRRVAVELPPGMDRHASQPHGVRSGRASPTLNRDDRQDGPTGEAQTESKVNGKRNRSKGPTGRRFGQVA